MSLAEALIANAPKDLASELRSVGDLDAILRRQLDTAHAMWATVSVSDVDFVAHVARIVSPIGAGAGDAREALMQLHASDLYLALACGKGDARAIAELERGFVSQVPEALARLASRVQADEVVQVLRAKLLVAEGGATPKILDYSGRGPLAGWLRIAAIRIALDMTRRNAGAQKRAPADVLLEIPTAMDDPELEHIRARHSADFKAAFEEALASLSKEDRNLLRLHLVDGLNIDEIGTVFQVHRATAARWIARCREHVHDRTKQKLLERLKLTESELRSLLGVLRSQLDLSINRLLTNDDYSD